jgi:hypothetical protein
VAGLALDWFTAYKYAIFGICRHYPPKYPYLHKESFMAHYALGSELEFRGFSDSAAAGAVALVDIAGISARLKPCPDTLCLCR